MCRVTFLSYLNAWRACLPHPSITIIRVGTVTVTMGLAVAVTRVLVTRVRETKPARSSNGMNLSVIIIRSWEAMVDATRAWASVDRCVTLAAITDTIYLVPYHFVKSHKLTIRYHVPLGFTKLECLWCCHILWNEERQEIRWNGFRANER